MKKQHLRHLSWLVDRGWLYEDNTGIEPEMLDLNHADLRYAGLTDADLRYANLRGAILNHADLRYVWTPETKISYADIRDIKFSWDFRNVCLYKVKHNMREKRPFNSLIYQKVRII